MDTNDIATLWAADSSIDETNLVGESKNIPKLHSKYYNLFYREVLRVKKLKAEYKELERLKREYYDGSMAEEDLKDNGWKPFRLKVLRQDVDKYIQSDKDIIKLSLTIDYHTANSNYLEDIIRTIHSRNFIIKNMIDMLKFQSGDY
ncbi:MAG: recombination mediator protein UvsY [Methylophagaceae bacterium]|jgi:hypothetical protein|tara:strand:- start:687 stop:1124 length:438 start_codon:yes stop_codon:yes gene_type:complete